MTRRGNLHRKLKLLCTRVATRASDLILHSLGVVVGVRTALELYPLKLLTTLLETAHTAKDSLGLLHGLLLRFACILALREVLDVPVAVVVERVRNPSRPLISFSVWRLSPSSAIS